MSKNKRMKELMIRKYGAKCFIEELGLRKPSEVQMDLKQYKGKNQRKKMDELTYHHIIERSRRRRIKRRKWSHYKSN